MTPTIRRAAVAAVAGLVAAGALSAPAHAIGDANVDLAQAGKLIAWGDTVFPAPDVAGQAVTGIATSSTANLALTADGHITAWNDNALNLPADLAEDGASGTYTRVAGGGTWVGAITSAGGVKIWGTGRASLDTLPSGLSDTTGDVSLLSLATTSALAVAGSDHHVVGWGTAAAATALPSPAPTGVTAIADYDTFALAVVDGKVVSWGTNAAATLPPEVAALTDVVDVQAGNNAAFALTADGHLYHWGTGAFATTGVGSANFPAALDTATVTHVSSSSSNAVASTDDGTIYSWGRDPLATGLEWSTPVTGGAPIEAIAAGYTHQSLAILEALHPLSTPTVTGTAKVGQTLEATDATFSSEDADVTGQWYRDSATDANKIDGATDPSYEIGSTDVGHTLIYRSIATLGDETATSDSTPTAAVVPAVVPASTVDVTAAPTSYGKAGSATVKVSSTGAVGGSVTVTVDGAPAGTAALAGGSATVALPATLTAGSHTVTASYAGNATSAPANGSATVSVAKATSTTKVKAPKKAKKGKKAKFTVTVTPSGGTATGKVTVKVGKAKGTGTLSNGTAKVKVKLAKKAGKQKVKVTYAGDANVGGSKAKATLKVK